MIPSIKYGNQNGRYFSQWRLDEMVNLAKQLNNALKGANSWEVWYDQEQDFHRLKFRYDGVTYNVRLYKIFAVSRDVDGTETTIATFNSNMDRVVDFFARREYLK